MVFAGTLLQSPGNVNGRGPATSDGARPSVAQLATMAAIASRTAPRPIRLWDLFIGDLLSQSRRWVSVAAPLRVSPCPSPSQRSGPLGSHQPGHAPPAAQQQPGAWEDDAACNA